MPCSSGAAVCQPFVGQGVAGSAAWADDHSATSTATLHVAVIRRAVMGFICMHSPGDRALITSTTELHHVRRPFLALSRRRFADDGACLRLAEPRLKPYLSVPPVDDAAVVSLHRPPAIAPATFDAARLPNDPPEPDGALRLKALVSAQRRLAQFDGSIDELAALVPGFALDAIEAAGAVFELFEGDALVAKSATPALQACIGVRFPLDASLSGEAFRTNRTLSCPDAKADPRIASVGLRPLPAALGHRLGRARPPGTRDRRADDREARAVRFPARRRLPARAAGRCGRRGDPPQAIERGKRAFPAHSGRRGAAAAGDRGLRNRSADRARPDHRPLAGAHRRRRLGGAADRWQRDGLSRRRRHGRAPPRPAGAARRQPDRPGRGADGGSDLRRRRPGRPRQPRGVRPGRRPFAADRADEIGRTGGRRAARDVGRYACVRPARSRHLADPGRMARHHHPARRHRAPPADLGGQVPARVRIESVPDVDLRRVDAALPHRQRRRRRPVRLLRRRIPGDDHQGHPAAQRFAAARQRICAAARRRRSACRGSTAARTARSSTPRSPARRSSSADVPRA